MNKKFLKLFAALALVGGMAVSCKDYEEQINSLSNKLSALETTVASLQSAISSGSVITSVTPTTDGYTVTLSDGKSFSIKNGADGVNGTSPKAPVFKIENGNLFVSYDGTTWEDLGKVKGEDGTTPSAPTIEISEDGYWVINGTKTTVKAAGESGVSSDFQAIWNKDNGTITFKGLKDEDGNPIDDVTIYLNGQIGSVVLLPQLYIQGISSIPVYAFKYTPVKLKGDFDKKTETWVKVQDAAGNDVVRTITLKSFVQYQVNPASAASSVTDDMISFDLNLDVLHDKLTWTHDWWSIDGTIVDADDEDGTLTIEITLDIPEEYVDAYGILHTGKPDSPWLAWYLAGYDYYEYVSYEAYALSYYVLDEVALRITKDDVSVVSDWAGIAYNDSMEPVIGDIPTYSAALGLYDYHYRNDIDITTTAGQPALIDDNGNAAWLENPATDSILVASVDHAMVYNKDFDLLDYVATHDDISHGCDVYDFTEKLGLSWKFEVVKNFKVAGNATPENEFVALAEDGHTLSTKVYSSGYTYNAAAIGRTPIVRVYLYKDENGNGEIDSDEDIVSVAYIKLLITNKPAVNDFIELPVYGGKNMNDPSSFASSTVELFSFKCTAGDESMMTKVEEMNTMLYAVLGEDGISKSDFHNNYTFRDVIDPVAEGLVSAPDTVNHSVADTSSVWAFDPNTGDITKAIELGYVKEVGTDATSTLSNTILLRWYIDPVVLLDLPETQTELTNYVEYTSGMSKVIIKLVAPVAPLLSKYNIAPAEYYINWTADYSWTKVNVAVPRTPYDSNEVHAEFKYDLNYSFQNKGGIANVKGLRDNKLDYTLTYYFDAERIMGTKAYNTKFGANSKKNLPGITEMGGTLVKFEVGNNLNAAGDFALDSLYITGYGKNSSGQVASLSSPVLVASINNDHTEQYSDGGGLVGMNSITLVEDNQYTEAILNAGQESLFTYIMATANLCEGAASDPTGGTDEKIQITFNGNDFYQLNWRRPIDLTTNAADNFTDAPNYGEDGTYIKIEDLIAPQDWRGIKFSDMELLWSYYDLDSVVVSVADIQTNFTGSWQKLSDVSSTDYFRTYSNEWDATSGYTFLETSNATGDTGDKTFKPFLFYNKTTEISQNTFVKEALGGTLFDGTEQTVGNYKAVRDTDRFGFLAYKNNQGILTKDFAIRVHVKVWYKWGSITSDWIEIPVKKTINNQ